MNEPNRQDSSETDCQSKLFLTPREIFKEGYWTPQRRNSVLFSLFAVGVSLCALTVYFIFVE